MHMYKAKTTWKIDMIILNVLLAESNSFVIVVNQK